MCLAQSRRLAEPPAATLALIRHGLRIAGASEKIVADPALEVFYRVSRGGPRTASHLLRASRMFAHDALDACDELELTRPRQDLDQPARTPSRKSRK